jgi:hypothetical protein
MVHLLRRESPEPRRSPSGPGRDLALPTVISTSYGHPLHEIMCEKRKNDVVTDVNAAFDSAERSTALIAALAPSLHALEML